MVEMDNLGTNYMAIYYITLSFIMPNMVNLNPNLGVMIIYKKKYYGIR
jgi:hypothetical protein